METMYIQYTLSTTFPFPPHSWLATKCLVVMTAYCGLKSCQIRQQEAVRQHAKQLQHNLGADLSEIMTLFSQDVWLFQTINNKPCGTF